MAQPLPIHSWKLMVPCEVSAVKLGASSLIRNMVLSSPDDVSSQRLAPQNIFRPTKSRRRDRPKSSFQAGVFCILRFLEFRHNKFGKFGNQAKAERSSRLPDQTRGPLP